MFELTSQSEKLELIKSPNELQALADLQLAMIGGGAGAASLD